VYGFDHKNTKKSAKFTETLWDCGSLISIYFAPFVFFFVFLWLNPYIHARAVDGNKGARRVFKTAGLRVVGAAFGSSESGLRVEAQRHLTPVIGK